MNEVEVNSAEYWESRFEGDWAQTQGCEQTRYFARILLDHLPLWLEAEIQTHRLSICDWGCAEGEAVDAFRQHFPRSPITGIDRSNHAIRNARRKFGEASFYSQDVLTTPLPVTFDVLTTTNVLEAFEAPWTVLRKLGVHVARHLVVLVPFREDGRAGHRYRFDDATIGTHIDPDFVLSSSKIIDCDHSSAGGGKGLQLLLVYSRAGYVPQSGATFDESASGVGVAGVRQAVEETGEGAGEHHLPHVEEDPVEAIILPALRRAESIAVVTCAIPFSSSLNQRPICCAKYFADRGTTVLFVEVWQCPEQAIHRTGEEVYPGVWSIPLYAFHSGILDTFQENVERIAEVPKAKRSYICTIPTRELVDVSRVLRAAGYHIHYDIMDDWEAFLGGDEEMTHWFSAPLELEMIALADTVTAVSDKLAEKFQRLRRDIAVVRNGYQPAALGSEQFAAARTPLPIHSAGAPVRGEKLAGESAWPTEHGHLSWREERDQGVPRGPGGPPSNAAKVVGYFGHLSDAWFDWETVFYAARVRPEYEFELIGYGISDRSLMRLRSFPNMRFVGLVPQKELHHFVTEWWAGMIPFQASTLSAAVDPLKVYEYLHFGLPTVVTGIPGVAGYPMVEVTKDGDGFVAVLDGLPDRPDERKLAEVAEFLKACVWEARLSKLNELMGERSTAEELAVRKAALHADARYWQAKAGELEKQFKQRASRQEEWAAREMVLNADIWGWKSKADALAEQVEQLSRVEEALREAERVREAAFAAREAALGSHVQYWQAKSAQLGERLGEAERLIRAGEEREAALGSRAAASGAEAANLRRLTSDLLRSKSWKIMAPLRFLTRPLLSGAGPEAAIDAVQEGTVKDATAGEGKLKHAPPRLLEGVRQAQAVVVIPCAIPFGSTLNQRPISCAKYLADRGWTVLFVVWQWAGGEAMPEDGQEVYPRIFHLALPTFQAHLEELAKASRARRSYLCSLPSAGLMNVARELRAEGYHVHYDMMDDWEEFQRSGEAPWYTAAAERELLLFAGTVSAVSEKLAQKFASLRSDIAVVPNGYDPAALGCPQFVAARTPLERPKVVGYFGHLSDAWFDWKTVWEAARALPEVEWELIGYGISDRTRARLGDFANIRFLGLIAQNDLHRYARRWWAGMIPFQPSALSAAVDPLKVYEYLHMGLPVVATGIPGIARYPLVQLAGDRGGFVGALDGVNARPSEQELAEVAEFLKSCVWDARLAKLEGLTSQPAGPASR